MAEREERTSHKFCNWQSEAKIFPKELVTIVVKNKKTNVSYGNRKSGCKINYKNIVNMLKR